MKIEILGTGCPKCEAMARHAQAAVDELGVEAEIRKVTDVIEIADRGAMITPALSVDGVITLAGTAGSVEEIIARLVAAGGSPGPAS